MELDETDPAIWLKLETATQEYVDANAAAFEAACNAIAPVPQEEDLWLDKARSSRAGSRGSHFGKGLSDFHFRSRCSEFRCHFYMVAHISVHFQMIFTLVL